MLISLVLKMLAYIDFVSFVIFFVGFKFNFYVKHIFFFVGFVGFLNKLYFSQNFYFPKSLIFPFKTNETNEKNTYLLIFSFQNQRRTNEKTTKKTYA